MKYVSIIITKGAQPKRLALKRCSSCPVRFRGQTGQLFYLLKKLLFLLLHQGDNRYNQQTECKDTTQCFKSNHITTPPSEASRLHTVMRCAKQRDCAPIHILPHSTPFVHIFLEVFFILCKYVLLFLVKNRSTDITPFAPISVV